MDSLVGYGSDDEHENDRYGGHHSSGVGRRREDDTNYEEVNMDMSEDSQQESEPELPQAERPNDRGSGKADSRDRERSRGSSRDRRDRRRESPRRDRERDRRSPRRDDRSNRADRPERSRYEGSRRGLLGDRPDDRPDKPPALMDLKFGDGAPAPRSLDARDAVSPRFVDRDRRDRDRGSRERERDRDNREGRYRDRRDEDRRSREPREARDARERHDERPRPRPGAAFPPPPQHVAGSSGYSERRGDGDYKPSSFKVNRKLEVMEKMGLQIKTPDGSMATAQQLRAAAHEPGAPAPLPSYYNPQAPSNKILDQQLRAAAHEPGAPAPLPSYYNPQAPSNKILDQQLRAAAHEPGAPAPLPSYYNPQAPSNKILDQTPDGSMATAQQLRAAAHEPGAPAPLPSYYNPQAPSNKILDQVAKRKLLWAHKKEEKSEAEKAAPWTGTRFAADQDGKQASKFMRLMGIRDPDAVKQEVPEKTADPIKKQEELFQAMQAQYEVARATTHTMRGVGLGFQRGQY
ncbi:arginine/serine-rich coiled-coil protein 2-like [Cydia fagiglandana]|uniref:arginine/serine-rich coiled-coil protein 2-like n=1 Tax=Cydia fagiglandana TaxID=1458189 RepID=UPI002FEE46B1